MRNKFSRTTNEQRIGFRRLLVWILQIIVNAAIVAVVLLLVWAFESSKMPALEIWHTTPLTSEFTSNDATPRSSFKDYLDQEDRLFNELHLKIYDQIAPTAKSAYSRYRADGPQDPSMLPQNWNRTFELVPKTIRGGALLFHGLSDSPYSLRRLGEILYEKGFYVLGLHLPGHGTIPGALTEVTCEYWVAASRIAGRHVRERIGPDKSFVVAGYSNGGALAVKYSMDALFDPGLPPADKPLLFSPEIGITPFSAIANTHRLYSFMPYFEQSKWLSIQPEYDPFKYNSFTKNAVQQGYEITSALQGQLKRTREADKQAGFPPVVTSLSWVDATVKTSMTINRFYGQLENQGNELVIFDVNRHDQATTFYSAGDAAPLDALEKRGDLPYRLTIIANASPDSAAVVQRTKSPHSSGVEISTLGMAWPPGIYSLSRQATPFLPDDPVYGAGEDGNGIYKGVPIGRMKPRGETGYLTVPLGQLMRLRHNPFFAYVEKRVIAEIADISR